MKPQKTLNIRRWRRTNRVRKGIRGDSSRPRLSVYRSNSHLYCQVIDDESGRTLAAASTRDKELRDQVSKTGNCHAAKVIGEAIAKRAQAAGITQVKFDRGSYKYHGRVAQLAEAARSAGLSF
ncbi:MAG: 50S ribosomal protein L18 [Planctomycetota bacterium]